jgi:hypothetical protein
VHGQRSEACQSVRVARHLLCQEVIALLRSRDGLRRVGLALDAGAGLPPRALFSRDFIALWSVAAVATALIAAALAWPGLRALLHFEPPAAAHLALTLLGVGLAVLAGWALGRRMEPGQQAASAAE